MSSSIKTIIETIKIIYNYIEYIKTIIETIIKCSIRTFYLLF